MDDLKERIRKYHEAHILRHKDTRCICAGSPLWGGCQECAGLHHDHLEDCSTFVWGWMYACDEKDGNLDSR